jgi:hypothetical protein
LSITTPLHTVTSYSEPFQKEIWERIAKGYKAFYANKNLFKSKLVSRKSKLKLYWLVIRPIAVYGCESWVLTESIILRLPVVQREILRKISGQTKEDSGIWRNETNKELDELISHNK